MSTTTADAQVPLPDLDTANKLRTTWVSNLWVHGTGALVVDERNPIRRPPVWPGCPVDTLPLRPYYEAERQEATRTDPTVDGPPDELVGRVAVRAGDRVTFTVPCESCSPLPFVCGWNETPGAPVNESCVDGRVPVFSAVIDPVPVVDAVGAFADFSDWSDCVLFHPNSYGIPPRLLVNGKMSDLPADLPFTESTRYVLLVDPATIEDA